MPAPRRSKRSGWRQRLLAPLRSLAALLGFKRAAPQRRKPSVRARLLPGAGRKRSLQEWKEQRRRTAAEVKAHLAAEQPLPAIKKLTRALLEDPQHPPYHDLLKKAVAQRRQRRLKPGRSDPWAELPRDLREEALQLEAFSVYVDELEQLFDKAGIPPLSAPPPPGVRQSRARAAAAESEAEGEGENAEAAAPDQAAARAPGRQAPGGKRRKAPGPKRRKRRQASAG